MAQEVKVEFHQEMPTELLAKHTRTRTPTIHDTIVGKLLERGKGVAAVAQEVDVEKQRRQFAAAASRVDRSAVTRVGTDGKLYVGLAGRRVREAKRVPAGGGTFSDAS